jgi:hypothetical protein
MLKISGLEGLSKELSDAQTALKELDGDLGTVNFNPSDPASIEQAIQMVEAMVDEKLSKYSNNSVIGPLAEEMKESYREAIISKAAAARLRGESN